MPFIRNGQPTAKQKPLASLLLCTRHPKSTLTESDHQRHKHRARAAQSPEIVRRAGEVVRFEVLGHSPDGVRFAEHAGEALPGGEGSDGRFCRGRLAGHTASVWRRSCQLRAVERRARRGQEEEEQRTAAVAAAAGREAIGGLIGRVGLRLRDLQLWLVQVVHFVLGRGGEWVVGGFM
jgi:hypothetical protein